MAISYKRHRLPPLTAGKISNRSRFPNPIPINVTSPGDEIDVLSWGLVSRLRQTVCQQSLRRYLGVIAAQDTPAAAVQCDQFSGCNFGLRVFCPCGHSALFAPAKLNQIAREAPLDALKAKLKCAMCGLKRILTIQVVPVRVPGMGIG
jgi:hypothetical protein